MNTWPPPRDHGVLGNGKSFKTQIAKIFVNDISIKSNKSLFDLKDAYK